MKKELLRLAAELTRTGEPFVVATVVRREGRSSAHVGDTAIITGDGVYHGWVGGSCTRTAVEREAARALADGRPRLLELAPEPDPNPRPGVVVSTMTCASGGTVEIYVEPVLVVPRVVVFGSSPIALALARLAKVMDYRVDMVDPEVAPGPVPDVDRVIAEYDAAELHEPGQPAQVVVATMGERDEEAIAAALAMEPPPAYLGVVASRTRFATVCDALVRRGVDRERLAAIHNPAGLDLGGKLPEEAALSILAEIVQLRRGAAARPEAGATQAGATQARPAAPVQPAPVAAAPMPAEAVDPVCQMIVTVAGARHVAEWGGRTWYFCCAHCRHRFLDEPERFAAGAGAGAGAAAEVPCA